MARRPYEDDGKDDGMLPPMDPGSDAVLRSRPRVRGVAPASSPVSRGKIVLRVLGAAAVLGTGLSNSVVSLRSLSSPLTIIFTSKSSETGALEAIKWLEARGFVYLTCCETQVHDGDQKKSKEGKGRHGGEILVHSVSVFLIVASGTA